jgi:cell division protein FtsW (lipid II flippase)
MCCVHVLARICRKSLGFRHQLKYVFLLCLFEVFLISTAYNSNNLLHQLLCLGTLSILLVCSTNVTEGGY